MRKMPKVSIIILNWNGLKDTRKCLNSLATSSYPNFEVVIVDNGSKRKEYLALKREFNSAKVIPSPINLGFAGGCNLGIRNSQGEHVLLLNNDTVVEPSFLEPLVKAMEKDSQIAACQPKIKSLKNRDYFDYAGAAGGFLDMFGYPFARGRIFFTVEKDLGQHDDACEIFWASGTAMLVRRSVLDKVGLFDEDFFAYAEEVDLCWRIHKSGLKVVCVPKSCVYHWGGATSNKNLAEKIFLVHRNHLLLLLKHYPTRDLFLIFPLRVLMDVQSMAFYLFRGNPNFIFSVVRAYLSLILKPGRVISLRRRNNDQGGDSSHKDLIYKGSIVFDYFIRRRKTYREIVKGYT